MIARIIRLVETALVLEQTRSLRLVITYAHPVVSSADEHLGEKQQGNAF